nr:RHS repeat domain-containing protein [Neobacillus fumarioli]
MTQIGGGTYFYHYNAHGDVFAVTDINGNVAASYTYDAWGKYSCELWNICGSKPLPL